MANKDHVNHDVPFINVDGARLKPTIFLRQRADGKVEQWCRPLDKKDGSARWVPLVEDPRFGHAAAAARAEKK